MRLNMSPRSLVIIGLAAASTATAIALFGGTGRPASAVINLDSSIRHQTFRAWEASVLQTVLDYERDLPGFEALFAQAAGDLGINRLQIAIGAGNEHPAGYAADYIRRTLSERALVDNYLYAITNDNDDPNVANLAGFEFGLLDWQMEHIVVPYRRALEASGQRLLTNLSYVDFRPSTFEHHDYPEEYAEFMLVLFEHLKARYGFVPDAINVMNEPDQTTWTGAAMGRVVVATANRLAKAGYQPDFMAPSVVNRQNAVPFFNAMTSVPGAAAHIKELSYHCYWDPGPPAVSLRQIAERAVAAGIETSQNECWQPDNDFRALHRDLKVGRNSSWQQATLNGINGYYAVDRATRKVTLQPKTKILRQYYRHIRPGAVRIEATTTDATLDPVAFVSANGRTVVVVAAGSAGNFTVNGLPAGTYGISYTTDAAFDINLPEVVISAGQLLTATIPAAGAITVYAK